LAPEFEDIANSNEKHHQTSHRGAQHNVQAMATHCRCRTGVVQKANQVEQAALGIQNTCF
jgi:hypothetical protein